MVVSNLCVDNYKIEQVDRYKIKFIVGKIIFVIVIIMVLVIGLVIFELFKIIDGKDDIEQYKNGFINLVLFFFGFSELIVSFKVEYMGFDGKVMFDKIWDCFEFNDVML